MGCNDVSYIMGSCKCIKSILVDCLVIKCMFLLYVVNIEYG